MDAAEWIPLLIVLLAVPGTLLLLFLGKLLWQGKVHKDLQPLFQQLNEFRASRRGLYLGIRDYSPGDREPYGSRVGMIAARLSEIDLQLGTLRRRCETAAAEVDRLSVNTFQNLFMALDWLRIWREIRDLRQDLVTLAGAFDVVRESLLQLNALAWDAALQARRLKEEEGELRKLIDGMAERKVHGKSFETAARQEERLRVAIRKIPAHFFGADQEELLRQADKESVADIFEILTSVQPELEKQFEKVRDWDRRYLETVTKVNDARQLLIEVDALLANMPPGLNLQPVSSRQKPMKEIAEGLFSTLARLEVESLPEVTEEAGRVGTAAKEMVEKLRQARRHQVALERVMEELNRGLKELSAQFVALAKNSVHPVNWNLSREAFADLSRQTAELQAPGGGRELDQVGADLNRANALLTRQKELARHCQEAGGQHAELLALLETAELKEGPGWIAASQELASKVAAYDPENWPKVDAPTALARDLQEVAERHRRLVSENPSKAIQETELLSQLENIRALQSTYIALRSRVEKIRGRYTEVVDLEKQARDRWQEAGIALSQLELLVRTLDFLNNLASGEIDRLHNEIEAASASLNTRQRGTIELKVKTVNDLVARLEMGANGWLDRLNADIEVKKKSIASSLETLSEIANLEERAVTSSRELLAGDVQSSVVNKRGQKSALPIGELVSALKPRADYWQACVAAIRELGDLEKQVVEAYQGAAQAYQDMKDQLALAAQYIPQPPAWPPTSATLTAELQEYQRIEGQWETLETQPGRALSVVRQLSDIAGKCRVVAERARGVVQRAAQEGERIEGLEDEIDGLFRLWQEQGQLYPEAVSHIRKLKLQTEGELSGLQRQYVQGAITYQQALQALSSIYHNLQGAQIHLQDGHILTLDGESRLNRWRA